MKTHSIRKQFLRSWPSKTIDQECVNQSLESTPIPEISTVKGETIWGIF